MLCLKKKNTDFFSQLFMKPFSLELQFRNKIMFKAVCIIKLYSPLSHFEARIAVETRSTKNTLVRAFSKN